MIVLELDRLTRGDHRSETTLAVRVRAEGNEISIDGRQPELIDPTQLVLSLRSGRTIACSDDPEEWVRGLAASFRTPYLSARVVEDTNPLPDIEIERANVREPGLD